MILIFLLKFFYFIKISLIVIDWIKYSITKLSEQTKNWLIPKKKIHYRRLIICDLVDPNTSLTRFPGDRIHQETHSPLTASFDSSFKFFSSTLIAQSFIDSPPDKCGLLTHLHFDLAGCIRFAIVKSFCLQAWLRIIFRVWPVRNLWVCEEWVFICFWTLIFFLVFHTFISDF